MSDSRTVRQLFLRPVHDTLVVAELMGDFTGAAWIDFGDETGPVAINPKTVTVRHTYRIYGAYMATVTAADGTVLDEDQIFVRPGKAPAVTITPGADNPNFIDVKWDDAPPSLVSNYTIIWGDGSVGELVTAPMGYVKSHGYDAGDYIITIQDHRAHRWGQYPITVKDKEYDPDFTLAQGQSRYEATVTFTRVLATGKEILIDWGDGSQDRVTDPVIGEIAARHAYVETDEVYIVQGGYSDGTGEGAARVVEIPWPLPRGPKPVSHIVWSPEATKPLGVRAKWWGSGWNYTLHWGDGTQERVRWQDAPTPHVYAQPGTYTITGVSDLHADWTQSIQVTVRATLQPEATFTLIPGTNRVKAALAAVAEPIKYQVEWGDHTITEHGANDLAPEHEYPWNTPAPQIIVLDVPSKRVGRFTGPAIGPSPSPEQIDGFFFEHVPTADESKSRRFRLRGGGLVPGQKITWYPWHVSWTRDVVADEHGKISDEIDVPVPQHPFDDFDTWRSYTVKHDGAGRVRHVGLHARRAAAGEVDVTFEVDDVDQRTVLFSVTPAMLGKHVIDFGDGTPKETVDVTVLPLSVEHRYAEGSGGNGRFVSVELPDGRMAKGEVNGVYPCPPDFNPYYPGQVDITWYYPPQSCGERGRDVFAPLTIDNGFHPVHRLHCPNFKRDTGQPDGWHAAFGYSGMSPGIYSFSYRRAIGSPSTHQVTVTKAARLMPMGVSEVRLDDAPEGIMAWFGDVTEWEGGYSGNFHVDNYSGAPVLWQVEFTLAAPAVLREVWPASVQFTRLTDHRWRIWSDLSLDEAIVVGVRVEPPGPADQWPDAITASIRQPPPVTDLSEEE